MAANDVALSSRGYATFTFCSGPFVRGLPRSVVTRASRPTR